MKLHTLLVGLLLCVFAVEARHAAKAKEGESVNVESADESTTKLREQPESDLHHRRKRQGWHMNYGYNYPPQTYYEDRRGYQHNEMYTQIIKLLDEIRDYLKQPKLQAPQPIYIPYTIPYPVPQYSSCSCPGTVTNSSSGLPGVQITDRFPYIPDSNQNWGFIDEEDTSGGSSTGSRPLNFDPVPAPDYEQSKNTDSPKNIATEVTVPDQCDAAVLSCCKSTSNRAMQKRCFASLNCSDYYNTNSCHKDTVARILKIYATQYQ